MSAKSVGPTPSIVAATSPRQLDQRGRRSGAQGQQGEARIGLRLGWRGAGCGTVRCRLDDEVGVGAAEPEAGDAGQAPAVHRIPGHRDRRDVDAEIRPGDVGVSFVEVEVGWDLAVLHGQDDLQHPGHPGRRFEVAEVRLDRAEPEDLVVATAWPEGSSEGLDLDRVAERGAGPVGLEVLDVGALDPSRGQRPPDDGLLGRAVRDGEPGAGAVLVDGRAPDDGQDRVPVGDGVGLTLERHHGAALTPDEAVGTGVEGLAAAVGGHHPPPLETQEGLGQQEQVDPAGQGQIALTRSEAAAGLVEGDQRRRAGGVDGHARALQAEGVGHPARGRVEGSPGGAVDVERLGAAELAELDVVGPGDPDEDAGGRVPQRVGGDGRPLQRFPARLKDHPLLGIQRCGFPW